MKAMSTYSFLVGFLMIVPALASAGQRCEQVFEHEESYADLRYRFQDEFSYYLNDQQNNTLKAIYDAEVVSTPSENTQPVMQFLSEVRVSDQKLSREAEDLIQQNLFSEQKTALLVSRLILRSDSSQQSVRAVDVLLETAGFTADQRLALQSNNLLADRLTKFRARDLLNEFQVARPETARAENEKVFSELKKEPLLSDSKRIQEVPKALVKKLFVNLTKHPVATLMRVKQYDPQDTTGFCFGRAFTGHIEALKLGIDKNSIRKVFVVGKLEGHWDYHVALMVRGEKNDWYVIDPIFSKPMSVRNWYDKLHATDTTGKMRLYVTEAERFGPRGNLKYTKSGLLWEGYNQFFGDVIQYYNEVSKQQQIAKTKKTFSQKVRHALEVLVQDLRQNF